MFIHTFSLGFSLCLEKKSWYTYVTLLIMNEDPTSVRRLTKEQKTGFVLLLVFGLLTAGLGFLQMRHNIYTPLLQQQIIARQEAEIPDSLFDEQTRLQQLDTDQDGINDYEELTFYQTSPYLPDSDSDGVGDLQELQQGTDPLCPEGESCEINSASPVRSTSTVISPILENAPTAAEIYGQALINSGAANVQIDSGINLSEAANDPDRIRELLLGTGQITREQLDRIDDDTLLDMAQDLLQQQPSSELNQPSKTGQVPTST